MNVLALIVAGMVAVLALDSAFAQQIIPLTDWRASIDSDLSKLAMPRDAHAAIYNILQAYERQAQTEKMRQPTDAQGQRHLAPPGEPPK